MIIKPNIAEDEVHDVAIMLEAVVEVVRLELCGFKPVDGWDEGGKLRRDLSSEYEDGLERMAIYLGI